MMRWFAAALSLAAVVLSGCGAYRLEPSSLEYIRSSDVIVVVKQQEINAAIAGSNVAMMTGGGLIPALIDASIENAQARNAEKRLAPIRDNLLDYDYAALLKEKIASALTQVDWLHVQQTDVKREMTPESFRELFETCESSVILSISSSYQFTADFTGIEMACNVDMWPRDEELRVLSGAAKRADPVSLNSRIHRGVVEIRKKLDIGKLRGDAAIEMLVEDNAAKVRKTLDEMAGEAASLIVEDLNKAVGYEGK